MFGGGKLGGEQCKQAPLEVRIKAKQNGPVFIGKDSAICTLNNARRHYPQPVTEDVCCIAVISQKSLLPLISIEAFTGQAYLPLDFNSEKPY